MIITKNIKKNIKRLRSRVVYEQLSAFYLLFLSSASNCLDNFLIYARN